MILLYHLIFPDSTPKDARNAGKVIRLADFRRQILWLKKHYRITSLEEYLADWGKDSHPSRNKIAITFDDGYKSTFDLITPFLSAEKVPATFFVTTSHWKDGRLLWFVYFNALCFEKTHGQIDIQGQAHRLRTPDECLTAWRKLITFARSSGDAVGFSRNIERQYPLPDNLIDKYLGMTESQVESLGRSSLFSLGGHTHEHPYLDQLTKDQQFVSITTNKELLEQRSGVRMSCFAYTGGVYNLETITAVREAGYQAAAAVYPLYLGKESIYELPRTDIYSPSILKLVLKLSVLPLLSQ